MLWVRWLSRCDACRWKTLCEQYFLTNTRRTLLFLSFFLSFLLSHRSCIRANIFICVYTHEYTYTCMYTHSFLLYDLPFSTSDFIILSPTPVCVFSVLQCTAVFHSFQISLSLYRIWPHHHWSHPSVFAVYYSMLQRAAACCSTQKLSTIITRVSHATSSFVCSSQWLQYAAVCCGMLQYVAVSCCMYVTGYIVLQYVAISCSMLQDIHKISRAT